MNLLDSKLKRLIPPTEKEATCRQEQTIMNDKREWAKEKIIAWLMTKEDGMVVNVRL